MHTSRSIRAELTTSRICAGEYQIEFKSRQFHVYRYQDGLWGIYEGEDCLHVDRRLKDCKQWIKNNGGQPKNQPNFVRVINTEHGYIAGIVKEADDEYRVQSFEVFDIDEPPYAHFEESWLHGVFKTLGEAEHLLREFE